MPEAWSRDQGRRLRGGQGWHWWQRVIGGLLVSITTSVLEHLFGKSINWPQISPKRCKQSNAQPLCMSQNICKDTKRSLWCVVSGASYKCAPRGQFSQSGLPLLNLKKTQSNLTLENPLRPIQAFNPNSDQHTHTHTQVKVGWDNAVQMNNPYT